MFLINLTYIKPIEEVEVHFEAHVVFLDRHYTDRTFIFSGRKNPRTGGLILANLATRDEVNAVIRQDPFFQFQVAEYEIIDFQITKYDERFGAFLID